MKDENEREQKCGNGRKRTSAATGMSINFHQLTQTVLTIPKLKRPARSCASLTAGPVYLHLPAYADVQTIKKNEYGVKMSIRANAGIRVKDEDRSKAGRSGTGLGENRK